MNLDSGKILSKQNCLEKENHQNGIVSQTQKNIKYGSTQTWAGPKYIYVCIHI